MTYTQAQIDKANAVDLEKFLRAQGETLVRSGKEYRWKAHDSLTVCGNKWFRHSQSKGGFPVDFVMEFYGKSFPEAVQMLTGEPGEVQPEADPAPSPAFRLPLRNVTNANILNYLTQERKLSPSLVNFFIAAGDIYEDAAHHNVVFVGRDADGHPRYASSRGIREKFRQDAAGAEKAFGFAHRGTDKQLLVFEAPIDLLSFIELFPKNWQQHNYLSLGGVSGKALGVTDFWHTVLILKFCIVFFTGHQIKLIHDCIFLSVFMCQAHNALILSRTSSLYYWRLHQKAASIFRESVY